MVANSDTNKSDEQFNFERSRLRLTRFIIFDIVDLCKIGVSCSFLLWRILGELGGELLIFKRVVMILDSKMAPYM